MCLPPIQTDGYEIKKKLRYGLPDPLRFRRAHFHFLPL